MTLCSCRRALISLIVFLGTLAGAGGTSFAEPPLTMSVGPYVSFAPADLHVRLDVTPNARNRSLVIVAESEDFYRGSEMPLDAEDAPRSVAVEFRGLPSGFYSVSGEVRDADGRTLAAVHQDIRVLSFTHRQ